MASDLQVKWRKHTYCLPATPTLTLATLKADLHKLTSVPPTRQKLIFPPSHKPKKDDVPLFPDGKAPKRPVMLLGTPVTDAQPSTVEQPQLPEVVDDLHELVETPSVPSPPIEIPGSGQHFIDLSPPSSPELIPESDIHHRTSPHQDDASATNGVSLGLETLSELLSSATAGPAFASQHNTPPWSASQSTTLMAAIQSAKRSLRMLAVMLFNFEDRRDESAALLSSTATHQMLAPTLESFAVYPADLSTMPDHGAQLLQRLGLHDVPAVIVLGDVGAGIAVVDMCHVGWFGQMDQDGGTQLGLRLQETLARFEEVYEMARVRRVASEERGDMIAEQDEALEQARREDMERQRALEEERERQQREEEEKRREEERRKDEREAARKALPKEPEKGTRVAVRMPDGRRVERRFREENCVADLFNFCVAEGVVGKFSLVCSFPRRVVTEEDGEKSLRVLGFVPSVMLNVDLE